MNISQKKLIKISQKTNGRCFYCNSNDPTDVDHFISRSKWSEWDLGEIEDFEWDLHGIENLFLSCKSCNSKKGAQCPEDFMGSTHNAWNRYIKANQRIGLLKEMKMYG